MSGERASNLLAVRCGGALLEARAPDLVPAYRRVFLTDDATGGTDRGALQRAFPVDERLLQMILAGMGVK